jgi:phosphoribosylformylglycinamidine synthase PurS subunit
VTTRPGSTAHVHVTLKGGVLDPQGKAVESALRSLGFSGIEGVRQGKFIELKLAETDKEKARQAVRAMCEKLLANTIIEDFAVDIVD